MNKLKMLSLLFFLIILPFVCASLDVEIDVKPEFVIGDRLFFDYTITSTETEDVGYTPYIDCPNMAKPLLGYEVESLDAGVAYTSTYEYGFVTENAEPQECVAFIQIGAPTEQRFEETFNIIAPASIAFRVLICEDLLCETESKTFVEDNEIYFSYISDVPSIVNEGILTYPDGKTKNIVLPISIKAEDVGTYDLEVTVSKTGYKDTNIKEQFAVIRKSAEISLSGFSKGPEGERQPSSDKEGAYILLLFLLVLVVILVILSVFIIYLLMKRKKRPSIVPRVVPKIGPKVVPKP